MKLISLIILLFFMGCDYPPYIHQHLEVKKCDWVWEVGKAKEHRRHKYKFQHDDHYWRYHSHYEKVWKCWNDIR